MIPMEVVLVLAPVETFSVAVDAFTLYGESQGRDPSAVFLHGMAGNLQSWDTLWQALGDDLQALRYDLRGFGRSGWDADHAYDNADDLLAVLDARQVESADLVGISLGGAVALNFALRHPGRVNSLVLLSPGLVAWEWSEDWRQRWRAVTDAARAGDLGEARKRWWRHPLFDSTRETPAGAALWRSISAYACCHWLADPHVRAMPDIERLHTLLAPTLLLTGQRDLPDFRLIADVIAASASRVHRVDLPECGHLVHLEAPAACAREIRRFWKIPGDYWV